MRHVDDLLCGAALRGDLTAALAVADDGWPRGWGLAAMGRYGEALTALEAVIAAADAADWRMRAAAHVTRASVLRQVGLHARAAHDDGSAALLDPESPAPLIGLVADGVGLGAGDLQARLAAATAVRPVAGWRQAVRLAWVTGEVALVEGDLRTAAAAFDDGLTRATQVRARRHAAKSLLFRAAVHGAEGAADAATAMAGKAAAEAAACGAAPLVWPALLVAADASPPGPGTQALLSRAGAVLGQSLAGLPEPLRGEAYSAARRLPCSSYV